MSNIDIRNIQSGPSGPTGHGHWQRACRHALDGGSRIESTRISARILVSEGLTNVGLEVSTLTAARNRQGRWSSANAPVVLSAADRALVEVSLTRPERLYSIWTSTARVHATRYHIVSVGSKQTHAMDGHVDRAAPRLRPGKTSHEHNVILLAVRQNFDTRLG
ncbi:MAG: hypothetical protein M1823_002859 [Watsoniomyces obsoletus]|nr:MAG: hypothetical protein M1823_002859 [Watsoniomyces obsoletus]